MTAWLRRMFARTAHDQEANIRESIHRDNLRALFADPAWVRGEGIGETERQRRMSHRMEAQ